MSIIAVSKTFGNNSAGGLDKLVLLYLANDASEQGVVHLSISRLSDLTGVSPTTVSRILRNLCARQILKKLPPLPRIGTNGYQINH
jgi:DNA-binding MarR family transcriptional regulator